ncbi:hypothetical protein VKT23_003027 [Stygiomarasmius scandens]|uniref:Uncharacterized protein n=1 Tax=Marasmiellus scandens TaxID=2682957 RepID=A0ABR1JXF6_9AGAR
MYALDNSSLASVGSEELGWLNFHATLLQQDPSDPTPVPMSREPSYQRSTKSSSAKSIPKRPSLQSVTPQEWLRRSPRSASATPPRKRPFPPSNHDSSSPTKFWTAPSRSSSIKTTDGVPSIPSLWFGASDSASPKPKRSASGSRTRPHKSRPAPVRSGSVSSVSSAMSSPPHTPTTPANGFKKFEPHHRCIIECDEDGEGQTLRASPTKGILAPSLVHRSPSSQSGTRSTTRTGHGRKISTTSTTTSSCTTSSSATTASSLNSIKSVKFVDTPTVHYASGVRFSYGDYTAEYDYSSQDGHAPGYGEFGYGEDWGGDPFSNYMGVEKEGKHLKQMQLHPYARVTGVVDEEDEETDESEGADVEGDDDDDDDEDVGAQFREFIAQARESTEARESLCKTPTPDTSRNVERSQASPLKRLVSLKRRTSTVSTKTAKTTLTATTTTTTPRSPRPKAQSTTHGQKPVISGPYALGSLGHGVHHPHNSANLPGVRSAPVLRSTPSVESFKSGKSAGAKSTKSLRSLKSLPESVKSSLSLRAKGMRNWFKGRVTVSIGG